MYRCRKWIPMRCEERRHYMYINVMCIDLRECHVYRWDGYPLDASCIHTVGIDLMPHA